MASLFRKLRESVSGSRVRYQDGKFDLDLTYITNRIIAMGLPAEGVESTYRNKIDQVSAFMRQHHEGHFMIINLSQRHYNYSKFNHMILDTGFPDHHSPPLHLLFTVCKSIDSWLHADTDNVVAIHCKAGKGRTGCVIACYLVYSGQFQTPDEALDYFALKRARNEQGGVTVPSQRRYVRYFSHILNREVIPSPNPIKLRQVIMYTVPVVDKAGCRPFIKIFQGENLVYSSKTKGKPKRYKQSRDQFIIFSGIDSVIQGDILVKVYHASGYSSTPLFRFAFHTGFYPGDAVLKFPRSELDGIHKHRGVSAEFSLDVILTALDPDDEQLYEMRDSIHWEDLIPHRDPTHISSTFSRRKTQPAPAAPPPIQIPRQHFTYPFSHRPSAITALAVCGPLVASASADGRVLIFIAQRARCIASLDSAGRQVTALAFAPGPLTEEYRAAHETERLILAAKRQAQDSPVPDDLPEISTSPRRARSGTSSSTASRDIELVVSSPTDTERGQPRGSSLSGYTPVAALPPPPGSPSSCLSISPCLHPPSRLGLCTLAQDDDPGDPLPAAPLSQALAFPPCPTGPPSQHSHSSHSGVPSSVCSDVSWASSETEGFSDSEGNCSDSERDERRGYVHSNSSRPRSISGIQAQIQAAAAEQARRASSSPEQAPRENDGPSFSMQQHDTPEEDALGDKKENAQHSLETSLEGEQSPQAIPETETRSPHSPESTSQDKELRNRSPESSPRIAEVELPEPAGHSDALQQGLPSSPCARDSDAQDPGTQDSTACCAPKTPDTWEPSAREPCIEPQRPEDDTNNTHDSTPASPLTTHEPLASSSCQPDTQPDTHDPLVPQDTQGTQEDPVSCPVTQGTLDPDPLVSDEPDTRCTPPTTPTPTLSSRLAPPTRRAPPVPHSPGLQTSLTHQDPLSDFNPQTQTETQTHPACCFATAVGSGDAEGHEGECGGEGVSGSVRVRVGGEAEEEGEEGGGEEKPPAPPPRDHGVQVTQYPLGLPEPDPSYLQVGTPIDLNELAFVPPVHAPLYLYVALADGTVCVWDAREWRLIRAFTAHESVTALEYVPLLSLLYTGSDEGEIKAWDQAANSVQTLYGHTAAVTSLRFTSSQRATWAQDNGAAQGRAGIEPQKELLFSASQDGTLRIWGTLTGQCLRTISLKGAPRLTSVLAHHGEIFSAAKDASVRVFDMKTQQSVATLSQHMTPIHSVLLMDGGRLLASGAEGENPRSLCLWNTSSRQLVNTYPILASAIATDGGSLLYTGTPTGALTVFDFSETIDLYRKAHKPHEGQHVAPNPPDKCFEPAAAPGESCLPALFPLHAADRSPHNSPSSPSLQSGSTPHPPPPLAPDARAAHSIYSLPHSAARTPVAPPPHSPTGIAVARSSLFPLNVASLEGRRFSDPHAHPHANARPTRFRTPPQPPRSRETSPLIRPAAPAPEPDRRMDAATAASATLPPLRRATMATTQMRPVDRLSRPRTGSLLLPPTPPAPDPRATAVHKAPP